jgi:hypothetical protein
MIGCDAGKFNNSWTCWPCPPGYFCPDGSSYTTMSILTQCSLAGGKYCPGGQNSTKTLMEGQYGDGVYNPGGVPYKTYDEGEPITCPGGYYCPPSVLLFSHRVSGDRDPGEYFPGNKHPYSVRGLIRLVLHARWTGWPHDVALFDGVVCLQTHMSLFFCLFCLVF